MVAGGGHKIRDEHDGAHADHPGPADRVQPDPVAEAASAVLCAGQRADVHWAGHRGVLPSNRGEKP